MQIVSAAGDNLHESPKHFFWKKKKKKKKNRKNIKISSAEIFTQHAKLEEDRLQICLSYCRFRFNRNIKYDSQCDKRVLMACANCEGPDQTAHAQSDLGLRCSSLCSTNSINSVIRQ